MIDASLELALADTAPKLAVPGPKAESATRLPLLFPSHRLGNNELLLMTPEATEIRNLTNHPADDTYPAWSPDGERIAFRSDRDGPQNLNIMDADGGHVRRLTSTELTDTCPSWSPDGRKIVFQRSPKVGSPNSEIYTINADGSGAVNLTNHEGEDGDPAWSPDGKSIAFTFSRTTKKGYRL